MLKLSAIWFILVVMLTALFLLCWQSFEGKLVLSETSELEDFKQSTTIATATAPPKIVSATLEGKPVYVLYVTQPEDTIIVRCYPTYEPTITVRVMGSNSNSNTQQEGVMTCRPSS
ncbi:MAG: hypothetical protein ACFCU7_08140 [Pleurocapsa sp.]